MAEQQTIVIGRTAVFIEAGKPGWLATYSSGFEQFDDLGTGGILHPVPKL